MQTLLRYTLPCAECGHRRPTDDGQNLEYDDPTAPSGVTLRFVCGPCLDHFNHLANEQEPTR